MIAPTGLRPFAFVLCSSLACCANISSWFVLSILPGITAASTPKDDEPVNGGESRPRRSIEDASEMMVRSW